MRWRLSGVPGRQSRAGLGIDRKRPSGPAAWLLRLPLVLYEHDLGWLLGHRFVEVTHRGRRSGQLHRSVVEVARFDPRTHEVIVVSAWQGRTDWYRNIQAQAALQIRTGHLRFTPAQRLLSPEETWREMESYVCRNPLALRLMPWLFAIDMRAPNDTVRAAAMDFFKGVSFRPREAIPLSRGTDRRERGSPATRSGGARTTLCAPP